jgi:hypothetical protein
MVAQAVSVCKEVTGQSQAHSQAWLTGRKMFRD